MTSLVEAIQAKAPIERVFGELDLRWPEHGWKFQCPLPDHDDGHPSAHVYATENRWWCFGCNRGGDQIDLWAAVREQPLATAIRDMAAWLGLDAGGSWEPPKPKEPPPELIFLRAANKAHSDVLRHLRNEYPVEWAIQNPDSWLAMVQATFRAYDEILRRYRNGDLQVERAYDDLLAWRRWALGASISDGERRRVYELDGRERRLDANGRDGGSQEVQGEPEGQGDAPKVGSEARGETHRRGRETLRRDAISQPPGVRPAAPRPQERRADDAGSGGGNRRRLTRG